MTVSCWELSRQLIIAMRNQGEGKVMLGNVDISLVSIGFGHGAEQQLRVKVKVSKQSY